ncbi:glutathione S-transferase [Lactococcus nasutitermitis]|uniref:Glutathione S-transferase n=1 Tax=Lactococcus nasutitermitis TaxID=1652957 RepID=A0ABV9JBZ6_9LACT|nr:glutathione S-transferase [Lactococcus nasutitermitis]
MSKKATYTLYYWPVPFRGHFIRAILSYAQADWEEGENVPALMSTKPHNQPIPFMGPPVLVNHEKHFALSQMPAIANYLGEQLNLLPESAEDKALALKIVADANDVIDELTLQGGMTMWTQESWQAFIPRLQKWMTFWEEELARSSSNYLVNTQSPTIADIVSSTLWSTVTERFPAIKDLLEKTAPNTALHAEKLWKNELADFAKISWDTYGDSYCGGQIEQSMRKVIK